MKVEELVQVFASVGGLDSYQARICIYYSGLTYHMKVFPQIPILELIGPTGTGKSETQKLIHVLCYKPYRVEDCGKMTAAVLRDELIKAHLGTFIGDEADCVKIETESYFGLRCSPTSAITVKRPVKKHMYEQKTEPIFGASVLTHRRAFLDQSNQNRAISVRARFKEGNFTKFADLPKNLKLKLPDMPVGNAPEFGHGRAYDTWFPLLAVASGAKDTDWLEWVEGRIEEAVAEVRDGQEFEPQAIILAKVIEAFLSHGNGLEPLLQMRANIQTEIVRPLRDTLPWANPYMVSLTLKRLGLTVSRIGGTNWVYGTKEILKKAAESIAYEDEILK